MPQCARHRRRSLRCGKRGVGRRHRGLAAGRMGGSGAGEQDREGGGGEGAELGAAPGETGEAGRPLSRSVAAGLGPYMSRIDVITADSMLRARQEGLKKASPRPGSRSEERRVWKK